MSDVVVWLALVVWLIALGLRVHPATRRWAPRGIAGPRGWPPDSTESRRTASREHTRVGPAIDEVPVPAPRLPAAVAVSAGDAGDAGDPRHAGSR